MPLANLAFCWNGVISSDVDKAASFYAETIGWKKIEHSAGNAQYGDLSLPADSILAEQFARIAE